MNAVNFQYQRPGYTLDIHQSHGILTETMYTINMIIMVTTNMHSNTTQRIMVLQSNCSIKCEITEN